MDKEGGQLFKFVLVRQFSANQLVAQTLAEIDVALGKNRLLGRPQGGELVANILGLSPNKK